MKGSIEEELGKMTGRTTIPSVWVNGDYLGGQQESEMAWSGGW